VIYAFDEADADLTLMPMASRRGLDAAGLKLSLASYQTLEVGDRRELVRLGAEPRVDVEAVRVVVGRAGGAPSREVPPVFEPTELPVALGVELAPDRELDAARWNALSGLDRYVLDKLHRNGKSERLCAAFDEIVDRERG
jgi:hypothetical protein